MIHFFNYTGLWNGWIFLLLFWSYFNIVERNQLNFLLFVSLEVPQRLIHWIRLIRIFKFLIWGFWWSFIWIYRRGFVWFQLFLIKIIILDDMIRFLYRLNDLWLFHWPLIWNARLLSFCLFLSLLSNYVKFIILVSELFIIFSLHYPLISVYVH